MRKSIILSIGLKKAFDRTQHPFMVKTQRPGTAGKVLHLRKGYKCPSADRELKMGDRGQVGGTPLPTALPKLEAQPG